MAYQEIAGGWKFANLRVGLTIMAPDGMEVYFQPGDDTAEIMDQIAALDEIPEAKRADIAAMVFGDYFERKD